MPYFSYSYSPHYQLLRYSGRRGVHCWTSDKSAKQLNGEQRKAIVEYFQLLSEKVNNMLTAKAEKKGAMRLHPMYTRTRELMEPYFLDKVMPQQQIFSTRDLGDGVGEASIGGRDLAEKYSN
jgi:DNA primase catalytic subunit